MKHATRHHRREPRAIAVAAPNWYHTAWWALVLSGLILASASFARAESFNHAPFNALLEKHVQFPSVDYTGLKTDEAMLDAYINSAKSFNGRALKGDEGLAFWINMYNAWTLKLILTKYPDVDSIKEFGSVFSSPWKKRFVIIGGEELTLGEIEHKILRAEYKDPRIHFAINCASRSCPPLIAEAYLPETVSAQLDKATIDFVNGTENTRLEGDKLLVSRIFKWYAGDFKETRAYINTYARGDLAAALKGRTRQPDVVFMKYDWSLNNTDS